MLLTFRLFVRERSSRKELSATVFTNKPKPRCTRELTSATPSSCLPVRTSTTGLLFTVSRTLAYQFIISIIPSCGLLQPYQSDVRYHLGRVHTWVVPDNVRRIPLRIPVAGRARVQEADKTSGSAVHAGLPFCFPKKSEEPDIHSKNLFLFTPFFPTPNYVVGNQILVPSAANGLDREPHQRREHFSVEYK